jgi:GNAT superfamily N-acetyltransferase
MENIFLIQNEEKKNRRDLWNFIRLRQASVADDLALADLLTKTFLTTYERKLPTVATPKSRKIELENVADRRKNGYVCVAELGYRIIGTFSLIHPESNLSEAWRPNGATLRCVAVDPDFHGLDLSTLLLNEAEKIAAFWRANSIFLHVQNEALKVAALYERHGYLRDPLGDKTSHGTTIIGYYKELKTLSSNVC